MSVNLHLQKCLIALSFWHRHWALEMAIRILSHLHLLLLLDDVAVVEEVEIWNDMQKSR
jgi:hypothetical protein